MAQVPNFEQSPFSLLGATMRDDRRRILALAEERSLHLQEELCRQARADLTNPRSRLKAEVSWFPGVSPNRVEQLLARCKHDPYVAMKERGIPKLAQANLTAFGFGSVNYLPSSSSLGELVAEFARLVDGIAANEVLRDINEDRVIAGFPPIESVALVTSELVERRRQYRDVVMNAFDRLRSSEMILAFTQMAAITTQEGQEHGPEIVHELADSYDVRIRPFLEAEGNSARRLMATIRKAAAAGDKEMEVLVDGLDNVVRNWDSIAQPIQLSMRARGLTHQPSRQLALEVRALAVELVNDHAHVALGARMTSFLQEVFSELPEVDEQLTDDETALDELIEAQTESEAERREWEKEITYEVQIGGVFKDTLRISPAGIAWRDKAYALESISRVRWGGIRHSVNGIPTGTTYTVAFGDETTSAVVELKRSEVYGVILDKLWRAVGGRLSMKTLRELQNGVVLGYGDAQISDGGPTLLRHRFFSANECVSLPWSDVQVWTDQGSFYIGSAADKKVYSSLSYIETWNAHVLEHLIRMAFKQGKTNLSELLN